jgi:hypothetical protein
MRTWPKVSSGRDAMDAAANNNAASRLCDLASDPIRMIFPPNIPERRLIAGIAGTFNCRMWRARPIRIACERRRHNRDKIQNKFAKNRRRGLWCGRLAARLQWPSEQTIGPLPAEKPELAVNTE